MGSGDGPQHMYLASLAGGRAQSAAAATTTITASICVTDVANVRKATKLASFLLLNN